MDSGPTFEVYVVELVRDWISRLSKLLWPAMITLT